MAVAKAAPLPRSLASQSLNFIPRLLARCQSKSIAPCELACLALGYPISGMKTVSQIRRENLLLLIEKYNTMASLNEALGLARTDATLSQIKNQSTTSRGNPKMMGVTMARRIERALNLPEGWMDNDQAPPSYRQKRIDHAIKAMEQMADYQLDQAIKIIDTLAEPTGQNGTND